MALADTLGAVGTLQNLPEGAETTTIDSSTKFIRAARAGGTVTAECTALRRGRTTMVWQTPVKSGDGRLCAVVTQTQLVLSHVIGIVLVALGTVSMAAATVQHGRFIATLPEVDRPAEYSRRWAIWLAGLVSVASLALAVYLALVP
jgi:hypothetical protein